MRFYGKLKKIQRYKIIIKVKQICNKRTKRDTEGNYETRRTSGHIILETEHLDSSLTKVLVKKNKQEDLSSI